MLIQGYKRARTRMLIPLRVSFTFSFNSAPSHQHCFKLARVERSLFVLKKRERKKKKIDGAPYESSVPSLSLSKHKDHYKSIKVCHVWNDISLCSRGIAWSVLVLDAAVAAVVAGCVVPRCQGLWGQAVPADRQRGRKPDSAAKPQSNVCLSSYLSLRLSLTHCWTLPICMPDTPSVFPGTEHGWQLSYTFQKVLLLFILNIQTSLEG